MFNHRLTMGYEAKTIYQQGKIMENMFPSFYGFTMTWKWKNGFLHKSGENSIQHCVPWTSMAWPISLRTQICGRENNFKKSYCTKVIYIYIYIYIYIIYIYYIYIIYILYIYVYPGLNFRGGLGAQFYRYNLVVPNFASYKKIGPNQKLKKTCL